MRSSTGLNRAQRGESILSALAALLILSAAGPALVRWTVELTAMEHQQALRRKALWVLIQELEFPAQEQPPGRNDPPGAANGSGPLLVRRSQQHDPLDGDPMTGRHWSSEVVWKDARGQQSRLRLQGYWAQIRRIY